MALGMVTQLPEEDQTSVSRKQMLARLDVCMGVRVNTRARRAAPRRSSRLRRAALSHNAHATRTLAP